MKTYNLIIILFLLFLFSCTKKSDDYKRFSNSLAYKYIQIGDGENINVESTLLLNLHITNTNGDTIHYVPDFPYLKKLGNHPIDSLFLSLVVGDSLSIRLDPKLSQSYIELYKLKGIDSSKVLLNVKILEAIPTIKSKERIRSLLSFKEIKEQENLRKYLTNLNDTLENIDGIYRKIVKSTKGVPLHYGDQITIAYKGSFLNGYVFDSTDDKAITPTFTFGEDHQLIDGIQKALIGLNEGETVKIILPSRFAFGESGSLAGIVPPYTTVIFDIKILKVSN